MNEMTNPYWWEAAPPAALPPSDLPAHAEIVIIGAGFTGLSAAITLARAGRDVVVIEKGNIGEAASARNGGITSGNLRYCLLYTSPSPRDGLLSRMPSSA